MKQLTILTAILFSGSLLAQSEYCGVGTVWDAETQTCIVAENVELLDSNLDGVVGVEDLLNLLSHFGDQDMDFDGIYDSVDDCVGSYDECGVCNGPGVPEGYCSCTELIDALGQCGGNCANDFDGDGICDEFFGLCNGLTSITFDYYTYELVEIGSQCWFAENLRTEHFANGDSISTSQFSIYGDSAECDDDYAQGPACDSAWSLNEYGRLYNYYAVDDDRGLCPSGWHVANDEDWIILELEMGLSENQANQEGYRGTIEAWSLKTTYGWYNESDQASNSSGFSALPGGYKDSGGHEYAGYFATFWTPGIYVTDQGNVATFQRRIEATYGDIGRFNTVGFWEHCSIRCIKD